MKPLKWSQIFPESKKIYWKGLSSQKYGLFEGLKICQDGLKRISGVDTNSKYDLFRTILIFLIQLLGGDISNIFINCVIKTNILGIPKASR